MMYTDPFDDFFDKINNIFGNVRGNSHINLRETTRDIGKDRICYIFPIVDIEKNEISVNSHHRYFEILILKGIDNSREIIETPYPILPKETKVKYNKNGYLEVTVFIDTDKVNLTEVEDDNDLHDS